MKILVCGCGSIGKVHALSAMKLGQDVALLDRNRERANATAAETGVSDVFYEEETAYKWEPDAVIIATPNHIHLSSAITALENRCHVLVEKPLSNTLEGIEEFQHARENSDHICFVVSNMRFHPAIQIMKNHLHELGTIFYTRSYYGNYLPNMRPNSDYKELYCAHREKGGGVILDAIHELDYLMWFFGGVKSITSNYDKLSTLDIDVEDFANLVLDHNSGVRSVITMDYLRPFKRRGCEIIGKQGILLWESEGKKPEYCRVKQFIVEKNEWVTLYETEDLDNFEPYVHMMKDFIESTQGEQSNLQTVEEATGRLSISLDALDNNNFVTGTVS